MNRRIALAKNLILLRFHGLAPQPGSGSMPDDQTNNSSNAGSEPPKKGGASASRSGDRATREEDAALMARVAANEQQAIAELYDRFVSLVFRMAYQALPTRCRRSLFGSGRHPIAMTGPDQHL